MFWGWVNSWKIVDLLVSHPQKLSVAHSSSTSGETSWIPLLSILELCLASGFIVFMLAVITTMSSYMHLSYHVWKTVSFHYPWLLSLSSPSFGMNSEHQGKECGTEFLFGTAQYVIPYFLHVDLLCISVLIPIYLKRNKPLSLGLIDTLTLKIF